MHGILSEIIPVQLGKTNYWSQYIPGSLRAELSTMGYSLSVRDSMMIAHSFHGKEFGPAQQMHGATYVVDCEFRTAGLVPGLNWVVDIGEASTILKEVLSRYNYKNLDEIEEFKGQNTTTEFMCKQIFDGVVQRFQGRFVGEIHVQLAESHAAWASYTGSIS